MNSASALVLILYVSTVTTGLSVHTSSLRGQSEPVYDAEMIITNLIKRQKFKKKKVNFMVGNLVSLPECVHVHMHVCLHACHAAISPLGETRSVGLQGCQWLLTGSL